jgi:hypothetical protein
MGWGNTPSEASTSAATRTGRSLDEIFKPAVNLENVPYLRMAVYGRAKIGKTHFALTAAQTGPVWIIDTEGAVNINIMSVPKELRSRIHVADILCFSDKKNRKVDLVASLDALRDAIDKLTDYIKDHPEELGTIVVDSATDMWDWMSIWLEEEGATSFSAGGKMLRTEWGKANKKYAELMYMLLGSGWNIILTFRAREAVNSKGESLGFDNARWQKNTDYWIDLICEFRKDSLDRTLRISGGRFGDSISPLTNPDWTNLLDHIEQQTGVTFAFRGE